jgi:hypothetical protein
VVVLCVLCSALIVSSEVRTFFIVTVNVYFADPGGTAV